MTNRYDVIRTDDNGNRFLVMDGLDRDTAERLVATFSARGHKQFYEICPVLPEYDDEVTPEQIAQLNEIVPDEEVAGDAVEIDEPAW